MTFSPGWCYQPGLKGPSLYIYRTVTILFIFYFSIYTSIIAAATAIFDLASVAHPHLAVELVSTAPPSSSTPARPASRAVSPPHPVSAVAPEPTLHRRPLPARPRRRAPPGGRRARLPHRAVVVPRPAAPIRPHRSRRLRRMSSSREVLSSVPWPASMPCLAHHPPQLAC